MSIKRSIDILLSSLGLACSFPVLATVAFLVWWQDKHSPFFMAVRVGKAGREYRMVKLRSMVVNAERAGVDSTSSADKRITPIGHFIRKYKLDELSQLWNVLVGDMSLVGPRPNVKRETDLYTPQERELLTVQPGITDFSSIVFADEGDILKDSKDPDIDYNQLIRPWKGRLGLFYIQKQSWQLDLKLILLTALSIVSRSRALLAVQALLRSLGADEKLIAISGRTEKLVPCPPVGASEIVRSR